MVHYASVGELDCRQETCAEDRLRFLHTYSDGIAEFFRIRAGEVSQSYFHDARSQQWRLRLPALDRFALRRRFCLVCLVRSFKMSSILVA
jgi:hypothetical protein